ncbi:MAG: protein-export chaperone SecB [Rhodospirillaceae bacterium]|nr:MAG: protein-export chaperone SecB [Rhodospirillaceae bacterium]
MNDKPENGAAEEQQVAPLTVNGQYIKDLSFESPNAPTILTELQNAQPNVNVNVDVNAVKLEGPEGVNLFEVTLDITADLKLEEKVGFILELKYAGVFTLNVPDEHINAILLIECPRMLFPYARNLISDTTRDGGFVPLFLQPIDFAGMYQANALKAADDAIEDTEKVIAEKSDDDSKTVN